ncbi:MAG: hypothetical protein IKU26_02185 [Clostridia bacterium]|nr:hypothetical protein [Clostridia bacterium]
MKKIAFTLSVGLILLWLILGAGTSLAWFSDSTPEMQNVFHFADFELAVSYRQEDGSYQAIEADTKIFDENALYEPGYVQVVYLKVENKGSVPFDFHTAVNVTGYTVAENVWGDPFILQDYLLFGLVTGGNEAELSSLVGTREQVCTLANLELNQYASEKAALGAGETAYIAVIVRMPDTVDAHANYRGDMVPEVNLGLIVSATQQGGQV